MKTDSSPPRRPGLLTQLKPPPLADSGDYLPGDYRRAAGPYRLHFQCGVLPVRQPENLHQLPRDDPAVCYLGAGSHGRVATCNDCHVPQDNVFRKYLFKANDGMRHAYMFTLRLEPQVIRIKDAGKQAVQENCIRCHASNIHPVALRAIGARQIIDPQQRYCWDCHRETPHGRVNSLTAAPNVLVPKLSPVTPKWLDRFLKRDKSQ